MAVFMRFIFVDNGAAAEVVRPCATSRDFAYYYYNAGIAWRLQERRKGRKRGGASGLFIDQQKQQRGTTVDVALWTSFNRAIRTGLMGVSLRLGLV